MKKFYDHLVDLKSIEKELDSMSMSNDEIKLLNKILEESLHHKILMLILSELSKEDRKTFLRQLAINDHNHLWYFLNKKTSDIEKKIIDSSNHLVSQMHRDIIDVKKLN